MDDANPGDTEDALLRLAVVAELARWAKVDREGCMRWLGPGAGAVLESVDQITGADRVQRP